jgi:hypothetical protein
MTIPKQYAKTNLDRLFIAYSYVYISEAIEALRNAPEAEAVVVQPYEAHKNFTSTIETLELYRQIKGQEGVPILFTPQGRMAEEGQFFEYGSRLLDVMDVTIEGVKELIEQKRLAGKWVLQSGDVLYAEKNVLIVKSPIVSLSARLPIGEALNILRRKQGEPVQAVAIPAPKLIRVGHEEILKSL